MLCRGETGAVFQLESAGMTTLVKDLQPTGFADLIPVMALYRPGPLGSGMVTDFINGRHGRKKVTYIHPDLEPILKENFWRDFVSRTGYADSSSISWFHFRAS